MGKCLVSDAAVAIVYFLRKYLSFASHLVPIVFCCIPEPFPIECVLCGNEVVTHLPWTEE